MNDQHSVIKKLNFKNEGQTVLVINAPKSYDEVLVVFAGDVHTEAEKESYDFVQVFGTSNDEIKSLAQDAISYVREDGLLWLCYPKKSSKTYKGSDCSRESLTGMLSNEGYEPVRQVAIDEDWSALRYRTPDKIKKMTRKFAVTEEGKSHTEQ